MKSLSGLFLFILKFYCLFKIIQWLFLQNFDNKPHPLSEIQHILVFLVLDIWFILSVKQIKEELENI